MVARTRLDVMLRVHRLSFYRILLSLSFVFFHFPLAHCSDLFSRSSSLAIHRALPSSAYSHLYLLPWRQLV